MASVRDSAEVKLIGFEQGVNIRTNEQLLSQTRSRFHPLANPDVLITNKADRKASITLRIKNIPTDPGDGNYTLHIASHKGSSYDLKIRVVGDLKATSVIAVNSAVSQISDLNNKTFLLSDFNNISGITVYTTFTFDTSSTRITRNSATSWTIGLSGISGNATVQRTAIAARIYNAVFQANLDSDLRIIPVLDAQTVKLTQARSGTTGNTTTSGSAIVSSHISIPTFSGGKNGLLRTLNIGDLKHPKDNAAYALGLIDPPGYYVGETTAVPYTDTINSDAQKIKRITFDINRIINYNSATTGISSKIVFDDTLLMVQETAAASVESAIGKKIKQTGLDTSGLAVLTGSFGLENWKMVAKNSGDFIFHDLATDGKRWTTAVRESTISVNFPSLLQSSTNTADQLFMTIEYTLLDDVVPDIPLSILQSSNAKKILFYIVAGGNDRRPFSTVYDATQNVTSIFINPYIKNIASSVITSPTFRQNVFVERLKLVLERLTTSSPLSLVLNTVSTASRQYIIKVSEKNTKLTYFKAFFEEDVLDDRSGSFLSLFGDPSMWINESNKLEIKDGTVGTKILELIPTRELYSPIHVQTKLEKATYRFGTKGISSISDVKNRIFDAIYLAKENNLIDITPTMLYAYARVQVNDGDAAHGTTAKTDRITMTSVSGVEKTYTIVHGGFGGTKAVRTGTILKAGSTYSSGNTIPVADPSIGSIAINIKNGYKKRDVLNELATAINGKNGHNKNTANSIIEVSGVDPATNGNQYLHLKQAERSSLGNNAITKSGFAILTIIGFVGANDLISKNAIKLKTTPNRGVPTIIPKGKLSYGDGDLVKLTNTGATNRNVYTLDDFSTPALSIELRDGTDNKFYYTKPNHNVEIRSFGFGKRTSDLRFYEDLSLNGPRLHAGKYSQTLDIDPVFFLTASPEVRFPIQVNNLGNILGSEYDGIIEPLEIRTLMLGRLTSERPLRTLKGEMGGEYSFSSIRNEASLIHNRITFEETKNVAFFDNCPNLSEIITRYGHLGQRFEDPVIQAAVNNVFYSKIPGIIFKNDARIHPYIDTEERIFQSSPLNGNNPEMNETDTMVLQIQELNHIDDKNLGGENFRRRAGFDFSSSPHPGTDSIVFGGLRYV